MFKAQEKALQDSLTASLTASQEALVLAKRKFAEQSEALKETGVQEISDGDRENQEDMQNETTKRVYEGFYCVVSSVQDLSEKAEIEEQQAKRQRKNADLPDEDTGDSALSSSRPAMQLFGQPGSTVS